MDSDEEQHLSKLLHACDEVLDFHDRVGTAECDAAISVSKSRRRFEERLRQALGRNATNDAPGRSE
jgi:hypothetical protein